MRSLVTHPKHLEPDRRMPSISSKKSKKDKKRRLSSSKENIVKEERTKKVKFESSNSAPAKCLSFPSKYTTELKVNVEDPDSAKNPVVVSFPAGLPSSMTISSNDQEHDDSSPPVFTWTKARQSAKKGRILHGSDHACTYSAMNAGRGSDGRLTKFYVAIYHKPTNTIKFIPSSEQGTVFSINQKVTSYHDSKSMDFRNLSVSERRRMVFESFGSSKKKKVLRSQDANVVEMKSVVGAGDGMMKALGSQIESGTVSESNKQVMEELKKGSDEKVRTCNKYMTVEQQKFIVHIEFTNNFNNGSTCYYVIQPITAVDKAFAEARRAFLPPFDANATRPYRVYDSQDVAGEEAWGQISRIVDACIHKENWKESLQKWPWPDSSAKLLDLVKDPQKKGAKYQIKTICLVNYLVKFHNRASKKFMDGTSEDMVKYLGLPKSVSDRFLELFCVASHDRGRAGYSTTKNLKDRRVVYTLVMYLLAHGKEMKVGSIEKLCLDMSMETKEAINLYREAGCKCVKGKTGMVSVSLAVPLVFPNPKRGKKT